MKRLGNLRAGASPGRRLLTTMTLVTAMFVGAGPVEASTIRQTNDVYSFESGLTPVSGASATLVRNENGASFTLHTSALKPGHAYTVWWVIFNNPQHCSDKLLQGLQCGIGDLNAPEFGLNGDPRVQSTILRAAGHVVGDDGGAAFAGHLRAGERSDTVIGPGLLNAGGAEVYLDVLDHGPVDHPGNVDNQLHTFITEPGSCNGYCADDQIAGFPGLS